MIYRGPSEHSFRRSHQGRVYELTREVALGFDLLATHRPAEQMLSFFLRSGLRPWYTWTGETDNAARTRWAIAWAHEFALGELYYGSAERALHWKELGRLLLVELVIWALYTLRR